MEIVEALFAEASRIQEIYHDLVTVTSFRELSIAEKKLKLSMENFLNTRMAWLNKIQEAHLDQVVRQIDENDKDLSDGEEPNTDSG